MHAKENIESLCPFYTCEDTGLRLDLGLPSLPNREKYISVVYRSPTLLDCYSGQNGLKH